MRGKSPSHVAPNRQRYPPLRVTCGEVRLEGIGDYRNREVTLSFQNEFLVAHEGDTVLATTADLIMLMDAFTGQPVTTEAV